jgi:hypothetical protein
MAISKTIETLTGIQVSDAYFRVESVIVHSKTEMQFSLRGYVSVDKPAFDNKSFSCKYDIEGANVHTQAYEYLKTLPEFEGATDC